MDLTYSALSMLGTINQDRVFYRVTVANKTLTGYADLPQSETVPQVGQRTLSTAFIAAKKCAPCLSVAGLGQRQMPPMR